MRYVLVLIGLLAIQGAAPNDGRRRQLASVARTVAGWGQP